jgi:hypothetical protein
MSDEFFPRDNRQPRHFWADNEVFDIYGPKLGAHGFAVYMALAKHAMNNSGECRTSMSKIATQLGMSKGGVFNALAIILQLGLAQKIDAGDNRHCAAYVLADVKALVDPNYAQLRLAVSVHTVNAKAAERSSGEPSVHTVNSRVHPVNAAFTPRTRNKEDKTSLQDLQDVSSKHHACGALKTWLAIKDELQTRDPEAIWIRPMYLLKVLSGNILLLALPPNGEIVDAARAAKALMTDVVTKAGYSGFTLTRYPDGYERDRLKTEYPEFHAQMFGNKKEARA